MAHDERIKRGGFTFTVFQSGSGKWYAGGEGSPSGGASSREAAIAAHLKYERADRRADAKKAKEQSSRFVERKSYQLCNHCHVRDTVAHRKTAKHHNAISYYNFRHPSRY